MSFDSGRNWQSISSDTFHDTGWKNFFLRSQIVASHVLCSGKIFEGVTHRDWICRRMMTFEDADAAACEENFLVWPPPVAAFVKHVLTSSFTIIRPGLQWVLGAIYNSRSPERKHCETSERIPMCFVKLRAEKKNAEERDKWIVGKTLLFCFRKCNWVG